MDIFKFVVVAGIVASIIIRLPHDRVRRANAAARSQIDLREKIVLVGATLGMMLLPLIYVFSGWPAAFDYSLPTALRLLGVVLFVPALWLFHRSHADLGRQWSPSLELRDAHALVTSGVYARIRHPMYSACFLWMIAQALLLPNLIAGLSGLAGFGLLVGLRVAREEAMMLSHFGAPYRDYMAVTGRLWPRSLGPRAAESR